MAAQRPSEGTSRDKQSPAVAAVLALIVERPSYAYEIWKRFEERFHNLYPVGKSRIYQVIDHLEAHGLVGKMEEDSEQASTGRQPRPAYRATAEGARTHREWLAASIQDDPRREELLRRLLATGARDARAMLQIIDIYEAAYLRDVPRGAGRERPTSLRDRLIAEEEHIALDARLKFVTVARRLIRAEIDEEGR